MSNPRTELDGVLEGICKETGGTVVGPDGGRRVALHCMADLAAQSLSVAGMARVSLGLGKRPRCRARSLRSYDDERRDEVIRVAGPERDEFL